MQIQLTTSLKFLLSLVFGFFCQTFFPVGLMAQGNLLVNPKRAVFEGSKRIITLNLANTGKDTAKYNISFLQYRMKEDGGFEEITRPDSLQLFADKYLRIFPRTVVLGPNEAQVVKVQLTRTNLLIPGEYRSHLYFRAVPDEKPLGETSKDSSKNISVKLIPIFGISIPVIIRSGQSTTKIDITDISFQLTAEKIPQLKLQLNRTGNMSVYGDLTVTHISPQGKNTQIGIVKGISVYAPNLKRRFVLNLNEGINYRSGKIKVEYAAQPDVQKEMFARIYLSLN